MTTTSGHSPSNNEAVEPRGDHYPLREINRLLSLVMEPLLERQIKALRKTSNIATFRIFLDMNDFLLDLATKGGRKDEMKKLARVLYGTKRKL